MKITLELLKGSFEASAQLYLENTGEREISFILNNDEPLSEIYIRYSGSVQFDEEKKQN